MRLGQTLVLWNGSLKENKAWSWIMGAGDSACLKCEGNCYGDQIAEDTNESGIDLSCRAFSQRDGSFLVV